MPASRPRPTLGEAGQARPAGPGAVAGRVAGLSSRSLAVAMSAQVASALAQAFQDDPYFVYAFPDPARRARLLPLLFAGLLRYGDRWGRVYVAQGGEGAAIWLGPLRTSFSLAGELEAGLWRLAPRARPGELARLLSVA